MQKVMKVVYSNITAKHSTALVDGLCPRRGNRRKYSTAWLQHRQHFFLILTSSLTTCSTKKCTDCPGWYTMVPLTGRRSRSMAGFRVQLTDTVPNVPRSRMTSTDTVTGWPLTDSPVVPKKDLTHFPPSKLCTNYFYLHSQSLNNRRIYVNFAKRTF
jgi:hypothetical protein